MTTPRVFQRLPERARRLLASPLLHFLVLGGVLFALVPGKRPVIVVRTSQVEQIRQDRGEGAAALGSEVLVEEAIDEAILLREAQVAGLSDGPVVASRLARIGAFLSLHSAEEEEDAAERAREFGLDHSDVVIRRYLVEMMRLAIAREADHPLPTERELEAHLRANPERFGVPERLRLRHVFVSSRHGAASERIAAELLSHLRAKGSAAGESLGDPFPHRRTLVGSGAELERRFGPEFVAALDASAVGRWQGPIPSAYGLHLVWIDERLAARAPAIAEIHGQLLHHLLRERRARHLRQRLDALRDRYEIRIESSASVGPDRV